MPLTRFVLLAGFVAVVAGLAAGPVCAVQSKPVWLSGAEIIQQFKDATIDGRYASGKAFTERYAVGGRVTYKEPGVTLGGHWSVTEGTLCTIYDGDPSGGCYRVARVEALGVESPNLLVTGYRLPRRPKIDGLLGLDFFRDRRLTLDFRAGQIAVD